MPSKKYERYFKPVSRNGFSSSGTYRGQGRVGQTSLNRTGNSCCAGSRSDGKSSITPLSQSELLKSNNNDQMAKCYEPNPYINVALSSGEYLKTKLPKKECVEGKTYQNIGSNGKPTTN